MHAAAGDELIETGLRLVLRIPDDRAGRHGSRSGRHELDVVDGELQAIALVERGIEEESVVVAAESAERD